MAASNALSPGAERVPAPPPRQVRLALAYTWVLGPLTAGLAIYLDDWRLLVLGVIPIFLGNHLIDRRWADSGPEQLEREADEADEAFAGTDAADDLVDDASVLDDVVFMLDHPEIVARVRYPTRVALVTRMASTATQASGYLVLLLALPGLLWLGAVGVLLIVASSGSSAGHLALALTPRFPTRATDAQRARWLRWDKAVDIVGWSAIAIVAVVKLSDPL